MKSTLIATATLMIAATSAQAENVKAWVEDRYEVRHVDVPYTTQDCVMVNVPIYGPQYKQGNAAEGALLGMILGGLAGKGVTGNDKGAAAGAIVGGIIGADKGSKPRRGREITGYTTEEQCTEVTRYKKQKQTVYDYSIIQWTQNGVTHSHTFTK